MTCDSRHSPDGPIQTGDVVVSRVNGTLDLYIIGTVASAERDMSLHSVLTAKGQAAAIREGYDKRTEGAHVWLFAGSAAAYVKARAPENRCP